MDGYFKRIDLSERDTFKELQMQRELEKLSEEQPFPPEVSRHIEKAICEALGGEFLEISDRTICVLYDKLTKKKLKEVLKVISLYLPGGQI